MKLTKILLCAAVAGAMAFAAGKVSAFPLKLTSVSGTISYTPSHSAISATNKAHYITKSFNLKTVMLLASNTLAHYGSNTPPANSYFVYDAYTDITYLTNSSGYYQNLSNSGMGNHGYYLDMYIEDMATSFKLGTNSGSEADKAVIGFYFRCIGPDTNTYYAGCDYGAGTVNYSGNSHGVKMSISGKGVDYGEYASSDDGVSSTSVTFSGTAASPEWTGAFWVWWY